MNKIYKTLVIAALAVASVGAFAQVAGPNGGPPAQGGGIGQGAGAKHAGAKHGAMIGKFIEKLNLTADQKAKVKALTEKGAAKRKDLMESVKAGKITKEEAKSQMKEMMKTQMEGLKSILTKEQMAELMKMMKEARGAGKPGGDKNKKPGKPGTPPPTF